MEITQITDVSSFYLYIYNNKYYFFFGDQHGSRNEGGCTTVTSSCDTLDDQYNAMYYHQQCTSIALLLKNWFLYNKDHQIKTDFYVEAAFTKQNIRPSSTIGSWLQVMPTLMPHCFIKDKTQCFYYPYIHAHYMDIRSMDDKNVDPFDIHLLRVLLNKNPPKDEKQFLVMKNTYLFIINTLVDNIKVIINALINPDADFIKIINDLLLLKDKCKTKICRDQFNTFQNILDTAVTRDGKKMFRAAAELRKLQHMDSHLANLIYQYYHNILNIQISHIQKSVSNDLLALVDIKFDWLPIPIAIDIIKSIINKLESQFLILSSIPMDVYMLSRMFLQNESQQIIVYAGTHHVKYYAEFFNMALKCDSTIAMPYIIDKRCLESNLLPNYLPADIYRQYALNKNL
ncbi:MAG TPA: hypothetical protein VLG50_07525 [Candidatus Saccharimonadales bacterium]|nr:hypothetical protein [Candidatus Saccharimonadales bacterium]